MNRNPLGREGRSHRAVYVISVAAELTGVHPQTLRIYERRGLLQPARTAGGTRRYSDADLARLQRIVQLTDEGLNLAGVLRVIQLEQEVSDLQAQVEAQKRRRAAEAALSNRGGTPGSTPGTPGSTPGTAGSTPGTAGTAGTPGSTPGTNTASTTTPGTPNKNTDDRGRRRP